MTARIYTIFEFKPETPAGVIQYARHLVAGAGFAEARAAIMERIVLSTGSSAYMTMDEAAEACKTEVMANVHMDHDERGGLTFAQARRWVQMHTTAHHEDGERHEPTQVRIW